MCFSWDFIKQILILAVVIVGIIGILNLLIPFIVRRLGITLGEGWAVVVGICRIFIWCLIAIFIIIFAFEVIACLWSFVGGGGAIFHRGP